MAPFDKYFSLSIAGMRCHDHVSDDGKPCESPFAVLLSDDNVHVGYYSDLGILVRIPEKAQDLAHS